MDVTIAVVVPVFGLILIGYFAAKGNLINEAGLTGLNNFVFFIAIPALLIRTMVTGVAQADLNASLLYGYFGATTLVFLIGCLAGRLLFGLDLAEQAMTAMAVTFSNVVTLGLPLLYTAYGEASVIPMTMIIACHSTFLIPTTTILIEIGRGRGARAGEMLRTTVMALIRHPVLVALFVGLIWGLSGLPFPQAADSLTALLAQAAAPCALFVLGATLTQYRISGDLAQSLFVTVIKLILHPLLVWLACVYVFSVPPLWTAIATITAALPVGANVFILAARYHIYEQRSASSMVISTFLSIFTVAFLLSVVFKDVPL